MKRYAPLAAPDDAGAWRDMSGFWPTRLGTYKNSNALTATTKTATGETAATYAYAAKTLTGQRAYLVGAVGIWEINSAGAAAPGSMTLTDRTGGVTIGANPHMTQFGNATICAMGAAAGTPTVVSTGGNFAALGGGSPSAEIAVTVRGCVLLFNYYDGANTYTDGWWASDTFDYTVWTPATSNEAANGRLLDTNGPIVAAITIDDVVYAFKTDSIYRGTYVGRPLIWQWDCVVRGIGAVNGAKSAICAAGNEILFAASSANGVAQTNIMRFDGVSQPRWIDAEVGVPVIASSTVSADFLFDDSTQTLYITYRSPSSRRIYAYNLTTGLWGRSEAIVGALQHCAITGDISAIIALFNNGSAVSPHILYRSAADTVTLQYPVAAASGATTIAPYVESHRYGRPDRKTSFSRVTPLLRSRATRSGGTPVCSGVMTTYRERHDSSAVTTANLTESTFRHRFDSLGSGSTENFAKFRVTFADIITEIDDLLIESQDAGAN